MSRLRIASSAGLLALAVACVAGTARAESDICMRLEARLMTLDSRAGDGGFERDQARDEQVQRLRGELDRATDDARRAGCLGGFFSRRGANCRAITANLSRMRANLNRLTRDRNSDDPFAGRERAELIGALAANQCGEHYETYDRPQRRQGFFATVFGGHLFRERGWRGNLFDDDFGTFRTLCVRTCDGYYFPISFATVRSRFAADEANCQAMCPGTDVALYIHRNPGEETEAMVSLAGEPYTALPSAFRYRREYDKSCSCGRIATAAAAAMTVVSGPPVARHNDDPWGFSRDAESPEPPGAAPVPALPPAAGEDPETLANRAGGFAPAPVEAPAPAVGLAANGQRAVRTVGPAYLYAQ